MRLALEGEAVRVKFDEGVIVKGGPELPGWPFEVNVIGPVAAPPGMTKRILVFVKVDTGTAMVPPPCLLRLTCGTAPGTGMKLVPTTSTGVPTGADLGLKSVITGPAA